MDYYDLIDVSKYGITEETLNSYQIVFLPENYKDCTEKDELFISLDTLEIYKKLKSQGISCADFTDLGVDVGFLERRNSDIWLGVVWVINIVALPIIINVLSSMIASSIEKEKANKNNKPLPKVHLEIKIKKGKDDSSSFKYSGDAKTLARILKSLPMENNNED